MSRRLFLQGASGVGKTELIIEQFTPVRHDCAGFITQRLTEEDGRTRGFCVTPIAEAQRPAERYAVDGPRMFLEKTPKGWKIDKDVFLSESLDSLKAAEKKRFIVLDEIGGIEVLYNVFTARLKELLTYKTPFVGVLKSLENFEVMNRELHLGPEYGPARTQFLELISAPPDIEFITVTSSNYSQTSGCVREFLRG